MLSLEINYSIIFPKAYTLPDNDNAVRIELASSPTTAPGPKPRSPSTLTNAELKTGFENPLYRVPRHNPKRTPTHLPSPYSFRDTTTWTIDVTFE